MSKKYYSVIYDMSGKIIYIYIYIFSHLKHLTAVSIIDTLAALFCHRFGDKYSFDSGSNIDMLA